MTSPLDLAAIRAREGERMTPPKTETVFERVAKETWTGPDQPYDRAPLFRDGQIIGEFFEIEEDDEHTFDCEMDFARARLASCAPDMWRLLEQIDIEFDGKCPVCSGWDHAKDCQWMLVMKKARGE